jgi:hypothetical protein
MPPVDGPDVMTAERTDIHVIAIGLTSGEWTIVSLHDAVSIISVPEAEHPPFASVRGIARLTGDRSIQDIDVQLAPAVHLKHAASRSGGQKRHVHRRPVERILHTVDAALDVREAEVRQEPCSHPIAFECGECLVFRRDLRPVEKFHPADLQRLAFDAAEILEPEEGLFHE